ncbi:hypothetical protein [Spiroplasma ixodetis]|uniref:hypothetical protein n=1 Tax=Spiroplasma ixodetis TaxID=2141 RepID=UPI002576B61E|nr:hypothetical protein [Spiroplasma ixodetis]WJG70556.1 hypothetical protein SIXOD_v1c17470 [Spiroplasma ixodetis Y32]
MPNELEQTNNYTLTKILRTGISPLSAMVGVSAYYGQYLKDPILGSINSLLFSKKLGIDIWNINQRPTIRNKVINSYKKIFLGLGTIGLINYAKFVQYVDKSVSLLKDEPCFWPPCPTEPPKPTYPPFTTVKPIIDVPFVDWDTYISLNSFGIANVISGLTELIPNRFQNIKKIANVGTGGCLISSGVAMGINNNFNNYFAIPTIIAGASEIINTLLLPLGNTHNNTELQEVFTDERARLINGSVNDYQSTDDGMVDVDLNDDSMSEINLDRASLNWDYSYAYTLGGV